MMEQVRKHREGMEDDKVKAREEKRRWEKQALIKPMRL
jgi:hypothetical protein